MGGFVSRWNKKQSTIEILESLEKEIASLQKIKLSNLERQKKIIGSLLLYSVLLYIGAAVIFYFYYLPEEWTDRLLYSTPLLVFPFIVWLLKRFLHWYFVKRIAKNDGALEELKEQKKSILEDVMEKETYKKAKEILEKFDPERFAKLEPPNIEKSGTLQAPQGQELRQRGGSAPASPSQTPRPALKAGGGHLLATPAAFTPAAAAARKLNGATPGVGGGGVPPPGPPLPRPIIPRERGTMDKLVEYLVGDGPQNRYALICKQCLSHNGMALREEFEFIAFRCCYCYCLNPARQQRPNAPRLPHDTAPVASRLQPPNTPQQQQHLHRRKLLTDAVQDTTTSESTESLSEPEESLPGKRSNSIEEISRKFTDTSEAKRSGDVNDCKKDK